MTIVLTDPPWQIKFSPRKVRPNQIQLGYPTMTLDEIKEYHRINLPDNANVFMWTIDKYLPQAEKIMKELGYLLHTRIIWDKGNGLCPAFTVRFVHEYLLWFYKKGHIAKPISPGKYSTIIRENSTVHSKKPEAAYKMIEDMFPDAEKIEFFSRYPRVGWTCFGNENKITGEKYDNVEVLNDVK